MPEMGRQPIIRLDTNLEDQGEAPVGLSTWGGKGGVCGGAPPRFRSASDQRFVDMDVGML